MNVQEITRVINPLIYCILYKIVLKAYYEDKFEDFNLVSEGIMVKLRNLTRYYGENVVYTFSTLRVVNFQIIAKVWMQKHVFTPPCTLILFLANASDVCITHIYDCTEFTWEFPGEKKPTMLKLYIYLEYRESGSSTESMECQNSN